MADFSNELQDFNFRSYFRLIQLFDKYACDETMRQLKICENICFLLVNFVLASIFFGSSEPFFIEDLCYQVFFCLIESVCFYN